LQEDGVWLFSMEVGHAVINRGSYPVLGILMGEPAVSRGGDMTCYCMVAVKLR